MTPQKGFVSICIIPENKPFKETRPGESLVPDEGGWFKFSHVKFSRFNQIHSDMFNHEFNKFNKFNKFNSRLENPLGARTLGPPELNL